MAARSHASVTDERGFITEGSGQLLTFCRPPWRDLDANNQNDILRGVSAMPCIDSAEAELGIPLKEADIDPYDVRDSRTNLDYQYSVQYDSGHSFQFPGRRRRQAGQHLPTAIDCVE